MNPFTRAVAPRALCLGDPDDNFAGRLAEYWTVAVHTVRARHADPVVAQHPPCNRSRLSTQTGSFPSRPTAYSNPTRFDFHRVCFRWVRSRGY